MKKETKEKIWVAIAFISLVFAGGEASNLPLQIAWSGSFFALLIFSIKQVERINSHD